MKFSGVFMRLISGGQILLLAIPLTATAGAQQQAAPASPTETAQPAQSNSTANPQNANVPPAPNPQTASSTAQSTDKQNESDTNKPVGTAIAPYEKTMGVTASRPAGAVIAPAKQRRIRAIVIKVGVIAAAGVAIGTVAALSHSSTSQPH
jgi:hypothetical protein